MWLYNKLYPLALHIVSEVNKKDRNDKYIECKLNKTDRLTYRRSDGHAYLLYGLSALWETFARYNVIDNAIQKLADYEDNELNEDLEEENN